MGKTLISTQWTKNCLFFFEAAGLNRGWLLHSSCTTGLQGKPEESAERGFTHSHTDSEHCTLPRIYLTVNAYPGPTERRDLNAKRYTSYKLRLWGYMTLLYVWPYPSNAFLVWDSLFYSEASAQCSTQYMYRAEPSFTQNTSLEAGVLMANMPHHFPARPTIISMIFLCKFKAITSFMASDSSQCSAFHTRTVF